MFAEVPTDGGANSPLYAWVFDTVRRIVSALLALGDETEVIYRDSRGSFQFGRVVAKVAGRLSVADLH
jgi:hypothetical protein